MAKAIVKLKSEGLTVLISEQNLHFAQLVADRALVMEKGIVRFDGTMQTLMSDTSIRERYLAV
jgi:branched-chain amino acid transport system ATP-binding protein